MSNVLFSLFLIHFKPLKSRQPLYKGQMAGPKVSKMSFILRFDCNKVCTCTCICIDKLIMFNFLTFRFLVLKTWKGNICLVSVSHATASESITQDSTPSLSTLGRRDIISGYLDVLFSWLRLYTCISPPFNKWIYKKIMYKLQIHHVHDTH